MQKYNAIISGSFLLQFFLGEKWAGSDVDFFYCRKHIKNEDVPWLEDPCKIREPQRFSLDISRRNFRDRYVSLVNEDELSRLQKAPFWIVDKFHYFFELGHDKVNNTYDFVWKMTDPNDGAYRDRKSLSHIQSFTINKQKVQIIEIEKVEPRSWVNTTFDYHCLCNWFDGQRFVIANLEAILARSLELNPKDMDCYYREARKRKYEERGFK
jgi:hypothetical protein